MGTTIRPEISKKKEEYISKHRYYELKHFCLQYPEFKKLYSEMCYEVPPGIIDLSNRNRKNARSDISEKRFKVLDKIHVIEDTCVEADPQLHYYILKAVTEGRSYDYLKFYMRIPCCKDTYYLAYRRFFKILDLKL